MIIAKKKIWGSGREVICPWILIKDYIKSLHKFIEKKQELSELLFIVVCF
jgi:hypothetical protein